MIASLFLVELSTFSLTPSTLGREVDDLRGAAGF
jgi:hypothetical protein